MLAGLHGPVEKTPDTSISDITLASKDDEQTEHAVDSGSTKN